MTFATIFPLVVLDKSQGTLVANDNYRWMENKVNKILIHPLTPSNRSKYISIMHKKLLLFGWHSFIPQQILYTMPIIVQMYCIEKCNSKMD
jgi:hypothetical protein